jgi:NADPH2:quinone reductase
MRIKIRYSDIPGYIKKLIEEGHVKPIVSKTYPLEKIVEAHRYVEKGHKRGGVAITIRSG